MHASRLGATATITLHALAAGALLSYEPARTALIAAAPIMVDWIAAPKPVHPEPPKPKPVAKRTPQPVEVPPVIATPPEVVTPSPTMVPAPPPPAPEPVPQAPAPVVVTAPIFNADYLDNPSPAYPVLSRRMHEEGRVILRVLVNTRGGADEVQINNSSGHARLDDSARETVKRWRFVPARRGSDAVPAWVLVPVSFRLEG